MLFIIEIEGGFFILPPVYRKSGNYYPSVNFFIFNLSSNEKTFDFSFHFTTGTRDKLCCTKSTIFKTPYNTNFKTTNPDYNLKRGSRSA